MVASKDPPKSYKHVFYMKSFQFKRALIANKRVPYLQIILQYNGYLFNPIYKKKLTTEENHVWYLNL